MSLKDLSIKNRILLAVVFAVFVSFLYIQFSVVQVQYDDYGYFTLNYGINTPHYGTEYSFSEMFDFLGKHYSGANGRLLFDGLMLTVFKLGGVSLVRIFAVIIVGSIWFLLYLTALSGIKKGQAFAVPGAVVLAVCYGSMHYLLHQHGTYWFSAFFTYYTPMIFLLLFVYLLDRWKEDLKWYRVLLLSLFCFFSSWSFETLSVAMVVLTVALLLIYLRTNKRFSIGHLLFVVVSMAGLLILIMSPGIRNRAGDRAWGFMGLGAYIKYTVQVFDKFFSEFNSRYIFFVLTACFILALSMYLKRKKVVDLVCAAALAVLEAVLIFDYYIIQKLLGHGVLIAGMTILILMVVILIPVIRYYWGEKDKKRIIVLFTAFVSIAALAAVPEIQLRVFIPFEICSYLLVFDACKELFEGIGKESELKLKPWIRGIGIAFAAVYFAAMVVYSCGNMVKTYRGYSKNAEIFKQNEATILAAKENLSEGEGAPVIELQKNEDDRYASIMLYQQSWFDFFVSRYYELPDGTKYVFE